MAQLKRRPTKDLYALVPTGKGHQTYLRGILVLADHNSYHLAQIVAVRRAVGPAVFEVSAAQMVVACSGGWLLGSRPPAIGGLSINTCPRL